MLCRLSCLADVWFGQMWGSWCVIFFFRALYGFLLSRFSSFTFWLWLPRTLSWLLRKVGPQMWCLRCGCVVVAVTGGDLPAGTAPEK